MLWRYQIITLIVFFIVVHAPVIRADERIIILEFETSKEVTRNMSRYVAKVFRKKVLDIREQGYIVITTENIQDMLPPGKSLEDCVGSCEVETGRLVGASFVVSGEIFKIGKALRLIVNIHNTKNGELISSENYRGDDMNALEKDILSTKKPLFLPLLKFKKPKKIGKTVIDEWNPDFTRAGILEINTDPEGANIEINGINICTTPCKKEVSYGRHQIIITKQNYFTKVKFVKIATKKESISIKMKKNVIPIKLKDFPVGTIIKIDQTEIGVTPLSQDPELKPGEYYLTGEHPSYFLFKSQFKTEMDRETTVKFKSKGKYGLLQVSAYSSSGEPVNADIILNDSFTDQTPAVIRLLKGKHDLVVEGAEETWSGVTQIEHRETTEIEIDLKPKAQISNQWSEEKKKGADLALPALGFFAISISTTAALSAIVSPEDRIKAAQTFTVGAGMGVLYMIMEPTIGQGHGLSIDHSNAYAYYQKSF